MIKRLFAKIFASKPPHGKIDFTDVQSILVNPIGSAVGDAIVLTAALGQLRFTYPRAKIGVISHPRNEFIFKNNPLNVELVKQSIFYALTHRNKWQLFLDCSPRFTTKGILFSFLLNFSYVICFEKEIKKSYNTSTVKNYNEYISQLDHIHLSQLLTLTSLNQYLRDQSTKYRLPSVEKEEGNINQFIKKDKLNVMVCPFGSTRQLDPQEFKTIMKRALEGNEGKFHLMFPQGHQSTLYLLSDANITQTILPRQTLAQWFCLISKADLVIAVDSAAVHVACTYQRPLVAFYGGKRPSIQFAPLPYMGSFAITPIHPMPKNFNGIMKGYDLQNTAAKIKNVVLQKQLF